MGFSRLEYPYSGGAQDFAVNFSLGYLEQDDVQVYVIGEVDGLGEQLFRTYTFLSEGTIRVTDPLPNPCTVVVERTVDKDQLEIDLESNGAVTRVTLVRAFRQLMMNIHELLDGRADQFTGAIFDGIQALRNQAVAAKDAAETAQSLTEDARDEAVAAQGALNNVVSDAQDAQAAAEAARDASAASATASAGSASDADADRVAALAAATAAAGSASTAATEAGTAASERSAAQTARTGAEAAQGAAEAARDAAQVHAGSASASATAASGSAAAAAQSAIDAANAAGFDPSDFAPAVHTHSIAQVTGLQAALDGKLDGSGSITIGMLPVATEAQARAGTSALALMTALGTTQRLDELGIGLGEFRPVGGSNGLYAFDATYLPSDYAISGVNNRVVTNSTLSDSPWLFAVTEDALPTTGKWYWEVALTGNTDNMYIGIVDGGSRADATSTATNTALFNNGMGWWENGGVNVNGSNQSIAGGADYSPSGGDVLMFTWDGDTNTMRVGANGGMSTSDFVRAFPGGAYIAVNCRKQTCSAQLIIDTLDLNFTPPDGALPLGTFGAGAPTPSMTGTGITNPVITGMVKEEEFTITGTTPMIDPINGTVQTWELEGNSVPTIEIEGGQSITLMIADGTSAYTVDWSGVVHSWVGGTAPELPETGFAVITLWQVGNVVYGAHMGDTG
jgi:hypothetical protein